MAIKILMHIMNKIMRKWNVSSLIVSAGEYDGSDGSNYVKGESFQPNQLQTEEKLS